MYQKEKEKKEASKTIQCLSRKAKWKSGSVFDHDV